MNSLSMTGDQYLISILSLWHILRHDLLHQYLMAYGHNREEPVSSSHYSCTSCLNVILQTALSLGLLTGVPQPHRFRRNIPTTFERR